MQVNTVQAQQRQAGWKAARQRAADLAEGFEQTLTEHTVRFQAPVIEITRDDRRSIDRQAIE
ncbi:hypothetical protein D3C72_2534150 [compost metagenome]